MNYISFLNGMLNYSNANTKVISNNIANANVPNYKEKTASLPNNFKSILSGEGQKLSLKTNNTKQITNSISGSTMNPIITSDSTTQVQEDGNNVDMNQQMSDLVKNQYTYNLEVQALNDQFMLQKTAMQ